MKLTEDRQELNQKIDLLTDSLRATNSPYPLNDEDIIKMMQKKIPQRPISQNENHKSSQTVETAFVPCESCDTVQQEYRQLGDVFIGMCNSQRLKSALQKFKPAMEGVSWMTGSDIIIWSKELKKDVISMQEHLSQFDDVRLKLKDEKKYGKELKAKISSLEKEIRTEKDTQNIQRHHYEQKIKVIKEQNADVVKGIEREKDVIVEKRNELQEQLKQFKEQLKQQEGIMKKLGW